MRRQGLLRAAEAWELSREGNMTQSNSETRDTLRGCTGPEERELGPSLSSAYGRGCPTSQVLPSVTQRPRGG